MEAIEKIESAVPDTEIRTMRRLEVGDVIHQGDVYLHRVADEHPRGELLGTRQIAVGTTVGSRHIVEGERVSVFAGARLPAWFGKDAPADLLGPVVVAEAPFVLTHPEHAHHRLPAGVYQTTYQQDYATQQRVQD